MNIQALSSQPQYIDSGLSNSVNVITSLRSPQPDATDTAAAKMTDSIIENEITINTENDHILKLIKHYERENDNEFATETTIPIKVKKLAEDYFDLDWSLYIKHENYDEFKVYWHCLNTNEHFEHRCGPSVFTYRIKKLRSGFTYCVKVVALHNSTTIVNTSKYFLLQTSASPDPPELKLRACNYKYITIEWAKPATYGDAKIVAYKFFVDGKVEAVLSSDQTAFTLSKGEPCREYSFQVQAMCNDEKFSSPISLPVYAVWPGVLAPNLKILDNEKGLLRLGWDDPVITGNSKIAYYRVLAECDLTNEVLIQGQLENNIRECEFTNMSVGKHKIHLEVYAYGVAEPFKSAPVFVDFAYKPEAPTLVSHIPGLEHRAKLDRIASSLINKRDRILKIVTQCPLSKQSKEMSRSIFPKAMSILRQLDDALNDCIKLIASYTGKF